MDPISIENSALSTGPVTYLDEVKSTIYVWNGIVAEFGFFARVFRSAYSEYTFDAKDTDWVDLTPRGDGPGLSVYEGDKVNFFLGFADVETNAPVLNWSTKGDSFWAEDILSIVVDGVRIGPFDDGFDSVALYETGDRTDGFVEYGFPGAYNLPDLVQGTDSFDRLSSGWEFLQKDSKNFGRDFGYFYLDSFYLTDDVYDENPDNDNAKDSSKIVSLKGFLANPYWDGPLGPDAVEGYSFEGNFAYIDLADDVYFSSAIAEFDPPTAKDDSVHFAMNDDGETVVAAYVLSNDKNPSGDIDELTLTIGLGPSHGSARVFENTIFYTPGPTFDGVDSLVYEIRDIHGQGSFATVTFDTLSRGILFGDRATTAEGVAPTSLFDIRDFDGNDLGAGSEWKYIGQADVQFDGDAEFIYNNQVNGRWATVGPDEFGFINFMDYGLGGETRVVGIYIDPEVEADPSKKFGPFDSQQRFQNDLVIDNLTVVDAFDFDGDGFQEIYFKVNDGSAYLRALMHKDGNIQYANYQSEDQVAKYLADLGYDQSVVDAIIA